MVFRDDGRLPMAGVRVHDVFHMLWIEPELNRRHLAKAGSAVDLRVGRGLPGNGHCTDTDIHALDLLRNMLGAKVVATYAHGRAPLPDTGPCSRCGATTTRYGPAGSPLCDQCRDRGASRPARTAEPTSGAPRCSYRTRVLPQCPTDRQQEDQVTGPDHYRRAEELLAEASESIRFRRQAELSGPADLPVRDTDMEQRQRLSEDPGLPERNIAEAHVHATLALAAATAGGEQGWGDVLTP